MNYQGDEQLELLYQLYSENQLKHDYEQEGNAQLANREEEKQKFQTSKSHINSSDIETRPDPGREQRKGTPEVIFAESKEVAQIIAMAQGLLKGSGRAIISRVRPEAIAPLREAFQAYAVSVHEAARAVVIYRPDYVQRRTGGLVGIISAGNPISQ